MEHENVTERLSKCNILDIYFCTSSQKSVIFEMLSLLSCALLTYRKCHQKAERNHCKLHEMSAFLNNPLNFGWTNQWLYSCINKHRAYTQTIPLFLLQIVCCSNYIKSWIENQTECWHIQKCVRKGASIYVAWKYHKYFHWKNKIIIKKYNK